MNREDLLNVKIAADMLDIRLGTLEVQKDEKVANDAVERTKAIHKQKSVSPKPYDQNDDIADNDADEDDEIVEITPEIYGMNDDEDEEESEYAPHFLMQAQYGADQSQSFNNSNGWMNEAFGEDTSKQPELIEIEGAEGEGKKFKCSFCPNKEFKKKPEVIRHFKKHIPLSQRRKFQCEMCKEKFISNSNMKTHLKVCTGVVKIYTCKRCKAEFDNKTDYEDHLSDVHNTGRNHECHICHKQLRRAGDVKKHMLTHSEGKPFVCDICGKRFRTESYVKVHKQAHFTNGVLTTPKKSSGVEDGESLTPIKVYDEANQIANEELNGNGDIQADLNDNTSGGGDDTSGDDMIISDVKYGAEENNCDVDSVINRNNYENEDNKNRANVVNDMTKYTNEGNNYTNDFVNNMKQYGNRESEGDAELDDNMIIPDVKYGDEQNNYTAEPAVERLI